MADACCGGDTTDTTTIPTAAAVRTVRPTPVWRVRELQLAALSGVLLLAGWLSPDPVGTVLLVAALVAGGITFVPGAIRGLIRGRLGVGLLMTIAAVGAVALGEFGEAAMLAFLFSIAEGLEGYAIARTRQGLSSLLSLAPPTATILRTGQQDEVPVEDLAVGDLLLIRPGERVATDATVTVGTSAIDTSVVTGESMPVEVAPGAELFAGTINGAGSLQATVTATAEDNSLARLVHAVHEAQDRKGNAQRLAERIARPLVPGVLIVAALVAVLGSLLDDPGTWIERALVVLVAAAPCAFALSVPIAVVTAVGAASKAGVLIKGGTAVEALSRVSVIALDKTGTLTRNRPALTDLHARPGLTDDHVLAIAAGLEAHSEHPLAHAVLQAATDRHIEIPTAEGVQAVPGNGVTGLIGHRPARLGKPGFITTPDNLTAPIERMQDAGASVVLIELDGQVIGALGVRDEIRPEARETVQRLHQAGLRVVMLTGDNDRTAAAIAREAGITEIHANLLPHDKTNLVTQLQQTTHRGVAMVGDGVNDAPALATADAGIAMGAMGADVAIEAADVALMGEDLRRLPDAINHARAARRIFTQNLALSGLILVALVPLAGTGVLGLAAVVATHELAEVIVILNGIRAGRRRYLPPLPSSGATAGPAPRSATAGSVGGVARPGVVAPTDGCQCCAQPTDNQPLLTIGSTRATKLVRICSANPSSADEPGNSTTSPIHSP